MNHHGNLLGFDIRLTGDVLIETSDPEDDYVHSVLIRYQELQGMAEAARVFHESTAHAASMRAASMRTEADNRHRH